MTTPPPESQEAFYNAVLAEECLPTIPSVTQLPATAVVQPVEQPKVKKRLKVEPADGSRLAALMAELPKLEAAKTEAEEKLKECKAAVQAEVAATVQNPEDLPDVFDIPADPYGSHPAYTLSAREGQWRIDTDAMKTQEPQTYVKWAKRGRPFWELKRVQKNRVKR